MGTRQVPLRTSAGCRISKPLNEISRVKVTEFPAISDAVTSESIEKADTLKGKPQTIVIVGDKNEPDNEEEPYTAVEQMPQFPGGTSELMKYMKMLSKQRNRAG